MKRLKLLVLLTACAVMMLAMSSCAHKAGTETGNQNTQGQGGGSGNVNITDNGGNGIAVGQNMEWPAGSMGNLPRPKGNVTAVVKSDQTHECVVTLSGCSKEDMADYVGQLKNLGYANGLDMVDANGYLFSGTDSSSESVTFAYTAASGEITVSYTSGVSVTSGTVVDMTDNAPWPNNFIKGVPELTGKIADVVNENNTEMTVTVQHVQKTDFEAFVKQLKQNGYTVESDESSSVSSISYQAYNSGREWVRAYLNIDSDGNTAVVDMEKASNQDG